MEKRAAATTAMEVLIPSMLKAEATVYRIKELLEYQEYL